MRCGYFDCFCGAAGDMILAAMIDAGLPAAFLRDVVERLRLPGVAVEAERVRTHGLAATRVRVVTPPADAGGSPPSHRHLPEILRAIAQAGLSSPVAERAASVFRRLAEAEAAVHGIAVERIHFHEVGAADAIVDVVGACAGAAELGLERIVCSPIPPGSGTVTCEHGVLPVPAPATAHLLKGVPLAACDEPGELVTPTGAAILTTLADAYGPLPALRIASVGMGAGTRPGTTRPNVMRLLIGQIEPQAHQTDPPDAQSSLEQDHVVVLEAHVDDAAGQTLAFACERLLTAGALDAFVVPIIMKKGRPGQLLTVLARPQDAGVLERVVLAQTTTFGVRRHACNRTKLARRHETVATAFGPIRVKIGLSGNEFVRAWPEYDDCAAAAQRSGATLHEVQQAALAAWSTARDACRTS